MTRKQKTKVWDPLIRLMHWTLAASCIVAWFTREQDYDLHLLVGYCALAIALLRILWGFMGSHHARFASFITGPTATFLYLRSLIGGKHPAYLGHNPAGAWMTVMLLLCILIISISGIALDAAENRAGPLTGLSLFHHLDLIESIHSVASDIGTVLVLTHVFGVLLTSLLCRENLIVAMISGNKNNGEQP